jgi:hypothetical protein
MNDNGFIEEALRLVQKGVTVTFPVTGQSMLPFIIGGKESVILHRPGLIDVGDVVLAWVDGNRYVVHRIIKLDYDRVTLMGDGNVAVTEHCLLKDVKARVTHVVSADNKKRDLYSRWRVRAAKLWYWLRPIRRYLLAIYRRL